MKRNYYVALRPSTHRDLHMTVHYHKSKKLYDVCQDIYRNSLANTWKSFILELPNEDWFGAHNNIRVLTTKDGYDSIPSWIMDLAPKRWSPHVTCFEPNLHLRMDRLAIMTKKEVVVEWELPT